MTNIFSRIKEKITDYIDVRVKLIRLSVISRTSGILSYIMYAFICLFILFCILLFSGFGLTEGLIALGLSRLVSTLITLGVYILMLLLLVSMRKSIIKSFSNMFIRVLTEGGEGDEGEDGEDEEGEAPKKKQ